MEIGWEWKLDSVYYPEKKPTGPPFNWIVYRPLQ